MGGVPSLILPNLWLGGQDVINCPEFFTRNGIGFVLSLGPAAPPPHICLSGREHINVSDTPNADLGRYFRRAVTFIAEGRHQAGSGVYVHCAAGISRSTTCVCAYLMSHLSLPFREVLAFIASRRRTVCPNDGFMRQLRQFEVSSERAALSQELRRCPGYTEIFQRDFEQVKQSVRAGATQAHRSVSHGVPRQTRLSSGVEQQQQDRALRAVREALASGQEKTARERQVAQLRIGRGDAEGDVGLGWLLNPHGQGGALAVSTARSGSGTPAAQRRAAHSAAPAPILQSLGSAANGAAGGRSHREGVLAALEPPPLPRRRGQ